MPLRDVHICRTYKYAYMYGGFARFMPEQNKRVGHFVVLLLYIDSNRVLRTSHFCLDFCF